METGKTEMWLAHIVDAVTIKPHDTATTIDAMVMGIAIAEPLADCTLLLPRVHATIGYLSGTMEPAAGNRVLQVFGVEHPYFGKTIPEDMAASFAAGYEAGQAILAGTKQEQMDRLAAELGAPIPKPGDVVDSDNAKELLTALRTKRDAVEEKKAMMEAMMASKDKAMATTSITTRITDAEYGRATMREMMDEGAIKAVYLDEKLIAKTDASGSW